MNGPVVRRGSAVVVVMLLAAAVVAGAAVAPQGLTLTVAADKQDRRFILAECTIAAARLAAPLAMRDAQTNQPVACQWEAAEGGNVVRWLIPSLAAGKSAAFVVEHTEAVPKAAITLEENAGGWISIRNATHEITRYYYRPAHSEHQKPYFYPLMVQGVAMTRSFPMEKKAGEDIDHPHHSSIWFAHGDVNGTDYWSKAPILHKQFVQKSGGAVFGHIIAQNNWGRDILETQDVMVLDVGDEAILDWTITLKAENGPVLFGKTKEGGFAVRVAQGLVDKSTARIVDEKGGRMIDADGDKGEAAIRNEAANGARLRERSAAWADCYGRVEGKPVGIAIMNNPASWRYPTDWHVRAYGLFAANAFFLAGEHKLAQGESITLRYRLYAHGGDPKAAKVAEVYAGYANVKVTVE